MLKVAYDISFLARHYRRHNFQVAGIFRVIESLMLELNRRTSDVDLKITSVCHERIIESLIGYILYSEDHPNIRGLDLHESFSSKSGLLEQYSQFYNLLNPSLSQQSSYWRKYVLRGLQKTVLKGMSKFHQIDTRPLLSQEKLDIFHSTYLRMPNKELTCGLQRVITIYDLIPIVRTDFVIKELEVFFRNIISSIDIHLDWAICISEYTKQEFCEHTGMSPERVFVTYLAAENSFSPIGDSILVNEACKKYLIPEDPYFLSIAALQPRKNLSFLIESFYKLISENPSIDHDLVLAGSSGWMTEEIFETINSRSDLKHRVHFTGYVEEEDLNAIYNGATAFIFPSLYEGFGLPILEAMQAGVPVISSNATSLPEVAGDAAILADPQDEDAFCQAMLNIIHDSSLRQRLKYKGLEQAKKFSWDKCADQTLEAYRVIANNKNQ